MPKAEFEEKDFEGPLYNQLLLGDPRLATPGQVFEGYFGIDAALFAANPVVWDYFGFRDVPGGVRLQDFRWGPVWRRRGAARPLPNFSTNLLVQAKRPFHSTKTPAWMRAMGRSAPYWRFEVDSDQHRLLEQLASTLGHRAMVVYASTAFHTLDDLYSHTQNETVVENCTFVRVGRMSGHLTWNYFGPGSFGIGKSEPEAIEGESIERILEKVHASHDRTAAAEDALASLEIVVTELIKKEARRSPRARYASRLLAQVPNTQQDGAASRMPTSFARLSISLRVLGVEWLVGGG